MKPFLSFIIPVFNRPQEIEELLYSVAQASAPPVFEVIVIEDGSTLKCETVCSRFRESIPIKYFYKKNTGPGDSRNYGMQRAESDLFIILDSDCILPEDYFVKLDSFLDENEVDCFGGVDKAHPTFSSTQKAIDFAITSILTTGGVRGKMKDPSKFQPRSFNMGLTRKAFVATGGFTDLHPGEDPELVFKLWEQGFQTAQASHLSVYHKRRIDWKKFYVQMSKFGKARVILNVRHPQYSSITYWFPFLFTSGLFLSLLLCFFQWWLPCIVYLLYFLLVFVAASKIHGLMVGIKSVLATFIQFVAYALGFAQAQWKINICGKQPKIAMPELFFDA